MIKYKINIKDFIKDKSIHYEELKKDGSVIEHNLSSSTLQSILSFIIYKYVYNKEEDREWVSIYGYEFQNICSKYKPYLSYLYKNNFILIDNSYVVADKTKGIEGKSRRFCFSNDFKKRCKIIDIKIDYDNYQYANNCFEIDKRIKNRIEKDFSKLIVVNKDVPKDIYKEDDDGLKIYNFKKYLRNITQLELLEHKDKSFFKWQTDCRLYTPFTYLSESIRLNNCSFGKGKLNNLDIKSSFPLFLSIWCIENGLDKNSYEMKEFCAGLKNGTFYSKLAYKLNNVKDLSSKNEIVKKPYFKKDAKIEFATWLNGRNVNQDGGIYLDNINYVMSRYYEMILELVLENKKEKNTFYYILSKVESNFIYNIVCPRLYKEIPKIKIITCHDSIYFEDVYTKSVETIWNEELNKLYDKLNIEEEDNEILDPELFGLDIKMKERKLSKEQIKIELNKLLNTKDDDENDWF